MTMKFRVKIMGKLGKLVKMKASRYAFAGGWLKCDDFSFYDVKYLERK